MRWRGLVVLAVLTAVGAGAGYWELTWTAGLVAFASTANDKDPSVWSIPPGSGTSIVPQVTVQTTTANLANGATIDFEFNTDSSPLFDFWVFADQILAVAVFVREASTGTFRQLQTNNSVANQVSQCAIAGLRVPGSQVRVRLTNNSGNPTTVLAAQVHSRSN